MVLAPSILVGSDLPHHANDKVRIGCLHHMSIIGWNIHANHFRGDYVCVPQLWTKKDSWHDTCGVASPETYFVWKLDGD